MVKNINFKYSKNYFWHTEKIVFWDTEHFVKYELLRKFLFLPENAFFDKMSISPSAPCSTVLRGRNFFLEGNFTPIFEAKE